MKAIYFLLFCFLVLLITSPQGNAQGFPCVIRGVVTVNGIPTQGVDVAVSPDCHDMTNSTGWYGVDAPSGTNITVTATYQGHSQAITVNTPSSGGFADGHDIMIAYVPTASEDVAGIPAGLTVAGLGVIIVAGGAYFLMIRKK